MQKKEKERNPATPALGVGCAQKKKKGEKSKERLRWRSMPSSSEVMNVAELRGVVMKGRQPQDSRKY